MEKQKENYVLVNLLETGGIHFGSPMPGTPSTPASISVTVNGKTVTWTDAVPFIDKNDRTMVPLRAVADAMGLTVSWDQANRTATFSNGGKEIRFTVGNPAAGTAEGAAVQMDAAAVIAGERTYAPIRYLAEYFGYTVGWDGAARTVVIIG